MADEITPVDSNQIENTRFIRTTDQVLGDPPGTVGELAGPINVTLQKISNSLLYLKNRVDGLKPDCAERIDDPARDSGTRYVG